MPYEYCQKIDVHILSFPTKDTHYTTRLKKYLDPKSNVPFLHLAIQLSILYIIIVIQTNLLN